MVIRWVGNHRAKHLVERVTPFRAQVVDLVMVPVIPLQHADHLGHGVSVQACTSTRYRILMAQASPKIASGNYQVEGTKNYATIVQF
jgi:hypothetical protein